MADAKTTDPRVGLWGEMVVPAHHPSLAGHFPGRPVVPGVVLLDGVVQILARLAPETQSQTLAATSVKFLAPVLPEEALVVVFNEVGAGRWRFVCRRAEAAVARGELTVTPPASRAP